ncbi:MAG TPA: TOBE domain-containing protein [Candidatus Wujingus californicus]|uniref:TOBE domain-containing protein n=1 Tax=Candidatus Wujingus californicus TaxID=3367618 RepID=UPI001DA52973|nr:TOBE domain-containing protein [Planctomycetota bacterium]MDO8131216.1 TOBE domain-containing protein [Candidatus Brocadiales bacterium]
MSNRLHGKIVNIIRGKIHAHVQILWKEVLLSVIITSVSCDDMHLSAGDSICVIIKGTDIMLAKSISGILSARNRTRGFVKQIIRGDVLSKVLIESQGDVLHAIITNASLDEMKINSGDEITAIVKSTELILSKEF